MIGLTTLFPVYMIDPSSFEKIPSLKPKILELLKLKPELEEKMLYVSSTITLELFLIIKNYMYFVHVYNQVMFGTLKCHIVFFCLSNTAFVKTKC